jgi:hypothetical protein
MEEVASSPQTEAAHHSAQVSAVAALLRCAAFSWVVGVLPCIFEIEHIVAEMLQTDDVLQIVPADAAQGVLAD